MGFLKRLFGVAGFAPATNALLAEYMYSNLDEFEQATIRNYAVQAFRNGGFPRMNDDVIREHLNTLDRLTQLNFIVYGFIEDDMPPSLKNEFWHKVRNPMIECESITESVLWSVNRRLKNDHNVEFEIKPGKIEF